MENSLKAEVRHYYNKTQFLYNLLWKEHALHYGVWYDDTRDLRTAVRNTNRVLAKHLKVEEGSYILDAGCGVGGTSVFLAENYKTRGVGITLSEVQLRQAEQLSKKRGLSDQLRFQVMDYENMDFPDATFDRVFGLESICYAEDKTPFLKEAFRVLKPGGRLCIIDGFLRDSDSKMTTAERKLYDSCREGWVIPKGLTLEEYQAKLKSAGFQSPQFHIYTDKILKTAKLLTWLGYGLFPITAVLYRLGIADEIVHKNSITCMRQGKLFHRLVDYGVLTAEKR